ncbi:hypothetical protein HPB52_010532 [Rhipicephalus sanguineus]|uniref:Uncharacterized protein n=1 Tax=Rhipicephalus sanguineus TaxID=34632 RepID=A0A9D4T9B7_RHISA|nr:hypothetical protein HPB52_010532 [Rhipicephalus sanguineus]
MAEEALKRSLSRRSPLRTTRAEARRDGRRTPLLTPCRVLEEHERKRLSTRLAGNKKRLFQRRPDAPALGVARWAVRRLHYAARACYSRRSAMPQVTQAPSESLHQYAFAKLKIIEHCPVNLSEAQKIDYLLHSLREQHILAAIAANWPPTVAEFISTCTSLDKSAQHLHVKASPSPFAGSVLPPSHPFRAAKPAERQQPR